MLAKIINLPFWIHDIDTKSYKFSDIEQKMKFVIDISHKNILNDTGGPFAAAIFNIDNNELISIGVNLVTSLDCSVLHAEVVAFIMAQNLLNTFDLSTKGNYELVTSSQMCCMCFGASIWSGVKRVAYGALGDDVEKLTGFDEGPKIHDWHEQLEKRGIKVLGGILREDACTVLAEYKNTNGVIYNSSLNKLG
jgi:tRNA(Arg) A34 adenosine deaminase TadA